MLDLYLPEGNGPFPVVINIHPRGFFSGDKDMVPANTGKALLQAGYAITSINYRLSGEAKFPAAVLDAMGRPARARLQQLGLHALADTLEAQGV